jgi:uncharacterized Ntn-hydrolase superfamily protein
MAMRQQRTPTIATFSIVARDPATGDLGVAVASKFLAVGAGVPSARANVGAVATQADANLAWGREGLELLAAGATATQTVDRLVAADASPRGRQVGVVDAHGGSATWSGPNCMPWAGGLAGDGFACQGNLLAGEEVVQAMAATFQTTSDRFAYQLLAALEAGDSAGGDARGRQSAAILVVREGGSYGGRTDRWLDLRVDDNPLPLPELRRLVGLHRIYVDTDDAELRPFDDDTLALVANYLARLGRVDPGERDRAKVEHAFRRWAGRENLEMRIRDDNQIDQLVLDMLELASGA